MKLILAISLVSSLLFSQILYEEYFTGGATQLTWHAWYRDSLGIGDSMQAISDTSTPGGDDWAGRISNEHMGMAGLTYAGISTLDDYSIEAWIYTIVTAAMGPYNGIAMRMDTGASTFYSLVSDFDSDARLRLRWFSGATPTVIRDWPANEIPGGVPSSSSWHKLKMTMIADSIWVHYDDVLMPGCPFINSNGAQGYFGVYTFHFSDTISTKCDNIIVRLAQSALTENGQNIIPDIMQLSVHPNPFSEQTTIHYAPDNTYEEKAYMTMKIRIYDASGRTVKSLSPPPASCLLPAVINWDGTDNANRKLPAGVYFVGLSSADGTMTRPVMKIK